MCCECGGGSNTGSADAGSPGAGIQYGVKHAQYGTMTNAQHPGGNGPWFGTDGSITDGNPMYVNRLAGIN